jgi:hypothetical protein
MELTDKRYFTRERTVRGANEEGSDERDKKGWEAPDPKNKTYNEAKKGTVEGGLSEREQGRAEQLARASAALAAVESPSSEISHDGEVPHTAYIRN